MNNADWNNLRAKLHHDWLQKYFVFLTARYEILDEVASGREEWRADIKEQFIEWKDKKDLFKTLLNECEEALSPRQLLNEPPLDKMAKEDKEWLGEVIHALYLERTGIKDSLTSLNTLFNEVNTAFGDILQGKSDKPSPSKDFIDTLTKFSRAISKLPHSIQVV